MISPDEIRVGTDGAPLIPESTQRRVKQIVDPTLKDWVRIASVNEGCNNTSNCGGGHNNGGCSNHNGCSGGTNRGGCTNWDRCVTQPF